MSSPNSYRGEVDVPGIGTLRFTWDRIVQIVDQIGPDFDSKISHAAVVTDLDTIAKAVAIGAGVTVDQVRDASPPITATVTALIGALNLAFNGQREAPAAEPGENPPASKTRSQKRAARPSAKG